MHHQIYLFPQSGGEVSGWPWVHGVLLVGWMRGDAFTPCLQAKGAK